MNYKSWLKYSIIVGALAAIPIYLSLNESLDDDRSAVLMDVLSKNNEVKDKVGLIEDMSVRKVTNYMGASGDPAYIKYLLKVSGNESSALVRVQVENPGTESETITVGKIND
nr:putative integron gene cassette protein [uncultured bacterium]